MRVRARARQGNSTNDVCPYTACVVHTIPRSLVVHSFALSHRAWHAMRYNVELCQQTQTQTVKREQTATLYACARALASYSPQKSTYRILYTHYTVTIPSLHCVYTVECSTTVVNSRAQCAISRPESELLHEWWKKLGPRTCSKTNMHRYNFAREICPN